MMRGIDMRKRKRICRAPNCNRKDLYGSDGYCQKHYKQVREHGKIYRSRFDKNETLEKDDHLIVFLYDNEQNKVAETIIDKEDKWLLKYKWRLSSGGYAYTNMDGRSIKAIHQVLFPENKETDHRDRDLLNNRKSNLRKCTKTQNQRNRGTQKNNTSGYPGVCWTKSRSRWQCYIKINGKSKHLGRFVDFEEAVKVRREAEKEYFGEFAPKHV